MGECRGKDFQGNRYYKDNIIVTHFPLVCFGGFGQPPCLYLSDCMKEHNVRIRNKRKKI